MKTVSADECLHWCRFRGIEVDDVCSAPPALGRSVLDLVLPTIGLKVVAMSNLLTSLTEPQPGQDTLVWLTDWSMWSESLDAIGETLWAYAMRTFGAVDPSPSNSPAVLFDANESAGVRAVLTLIMLFQWDALVVPGSAAYCVRLRHDRPIRIHVLDRSLMPSLSASVDEWRRLEERGGHP